MSLAGTAGEVKSIRGPPGDQGLDGIQGPPGHSVSIRMQVDIALNSYMIITACRGAEDYTLVTDHRLQCALQNTSLLLKELVIKTHLFHIYYK